MYKNWSKFHNKQVGGYSDGIIILSLKNSIYR